MTCETCGQPLQIADWPFCPHGRGHSNIVPDECDFVSRNGEAQPVRFRSRQEHRRWLKQHGYRIYDTGTGGKSANVITQKTLDDARIMLERPSRAAADAQRAPGITSFDGLTRYLKEHRGA